MPHHGCVGGENVCPFGSIFKNVLHLPLHTPPKEKPRYLLDSGVSFVYLVPER